MLLVGTSNWAISAAGTVMHSVSQSTFGSPCTLAPNGFDSGFQPANNQFTITITNASQRKFQFWPVSISYLRLSFSHLVLLPSDYIVIFPSCPGP
jgi:hypothetical protein